MAVTTDPDIPGITAGMVDVYDEGVLTVDNADSLDFVGAAVTVDSPSAGRARVTITGGAPADATFFVLSANATLTVERVWTPGTGLAAVDSGAGLAYTVSANLSTGVAGGQAAIGGTGAAENLTLRATSHATDGAIIFQSDTTTETARILATGEPLWGATALIVSEFARFHRTQAASTTVLVSNLSAAAGAVAQVGARNDMTASTVLGATGSGGAVGFIPANFGFVRADTAFAGLAIMTGGTSPVSIYTSDLQRATFLSTGEF